MLAEGDGCSYHGRLAVGGAPMCPVFVISYAPGASPVSSVIVTGGRHRFRARKARALRVVVGGDALHGAVLEHSSPMSPDSELVSACRRQRRVGTSLGRPALRADPREPQHSRYVRELCSDRVRVAPRNARRRPCRVVSGAPWPSSTAGSAPSTRRPLDVGPRCPCATTIANLGPTHLAPRSSSCQSEVSRLPLESSCVCVVYCSYLTHECD